MRTTSTCRVWSDAARELPPQHEVSSFFADFAVYDVVGAGVETLTWAAALVVVARRFGVFDHRNRSRALLRLSADRRRMATGSSSPT